VLRPAHGYDHEHTVRRHEHVRGCTLRRSPADTPAPRHLDSSEPPGGERFNPSVSYGSSDLYKTPGLSSQSILTKASSYSGELGM